MVIKQMFRLAGIAGLVVMAACNGPVGPSADCSYDPDGNSTTCSVPEAQVEASKVAR